MANNYQLEKATTYGFLAQVRNSGSFANGPVDVFTPIVMKGLHSFCVKKRKDGGENIDEIGEVIFEDYKIRIPHGVLNIILKSIAKRLKNGNEEPLKIYNDGGFEVKAYACMDFDEQLAQAKSEAKLLQELYEQFCIVYEYDCKNIPDVIEFIDENKHAISSYLVNAANKSTRDFTVPAQFVDFCKKIPVAYEMLRNIYLGSVITCYLDYTPKQAKLGVDLLLDTNFIISLIDLNTQESTATCRRLLDICRQIGYTFHVLIDTVEETKTLLRKKSKYFDLSVVQSYINKEDVYGACVRKGYNASDLDKAADNLERTLENFGILIVPNTDKLEGKAKFSEEYRILKPFRNSNKSALHDAKAIYYVKEKRGKDITDFSDVNCWFVNNAITHDSDRESIESLMGLRRENVQPEIIRADDLLNIIWLSNPQINTELANHEVSEIGLTSLVSLTLNRSLPKTRIIRELDENIQKYRTDEVTDRDVLLLSARITNYQLSSQDVIELNNCAKQNRQEFARRLKEEAEKEAEKEKERNEKINKVITTTTINIKALLKGKIEITKTVQEENASLRSDLQAKDAEIQKLQKAAKEKENEIRKGKRDLFIKKELKRWRKGPLILLLAFMLLFVLGVVWIVLIYTCDSQEEARKNVEEFWKIPVLPSAFTIIMAIVNGIIIKAIYDRCLNPTSINAFIARLHIPEDMKELL
jgi:hypothetical protein